MKNWNRKIISNISVQPTTQQNSKPELTMSMSMSDSLDQRHPTLKKHNMTIDLLKRSPDFFWVNRRTDTSDSSAGKCHCQYVFSSAPQSTNTIRLSPPLRKRCWESFRSIRVQCHELRIVFYGRWYGRPHSSR